MDLLLLHNHLAGATRFDRPTLTALLQDRGHRVQCCETDAPDLMARMHETHDAIVVAGGDGTAARIFAVASRDCPPLAVLPLGTANNIAVGIGVRRPVPELIDGLEAGRVIDFDSGRASGPWDDARFFESVGVGVFGAALGPVNRRRVPSEDKVNEGLTALAEGVATGVPIEITLTLDGVSSQEPLLLVEVLRAPAIGPALTFAPEVEPDDGLLHVARARPEDREALARWLRNPYRHPAPVDVVTARAVEILWHDADFHRDDYFHDGMPLPQRISATIETAAFRLLIPGGDS